MKVLMTTDGSSQATTAIRTACRLLRRKGRQVDLLCVAPGFAAPRKREKKAETLRREEEYKRRIDEEANRILAGAKAVLKSEGAEAASLTEIGSPAGVILRRASDYDVTVLGAYDQYERGKVGLGPVAARVVANAPNAVLIGRETDAGRNSLRILAATDGSLASEHALRSMAGFFHMEGAEITLIHIVETPWIHLGLEQDWFGRPGNLFARSDPEAQIDHELRMEAEDVLVESQRLLEGLSLSAETIVEEGDPALEILSEAEKGEYDLIVLGAAGEQGLKHQMLGSVSTKVAQNAPCSVFVARFVE
ncbi:MAG: universal stress protein [Blastocatellia bacterium]|nr:universal stress protein [Blastocatellia bacterium]